MNSETIAQKTFTAVVHFLKSMLDESTSQTFQMGLESTFPTWPVLWNMLEKFLRQHSLKDMPDSILSFAEMLPDYTSFAEGLKQSLSLHEEFWNKVYQNLCLAKSRLPSC
ncbi:uncharacterized protein CEXT_656591 [Caerostris extrusa]|uniref:Uncharacterized protein n=1 Tax=Caerostris extrusa TaxID=172846 RepID=A0AAV4X303_CAEEX|nr:uncharacterized protein CEXT_656591 [Caerostris extrusa]